MGNTKYIILEVAYEYNHACKKPVRTQARYKAMDGTKAKAAHSQRSE